MKHPIFTLFCVMALGLFSISCSDDCNCNNNEDEPEVIDPELEEIPSLSDIPSDEHMLIVVQTTADNQTVKLPFTGSVACVVRWETYKDEEKFASEYPTHVYEKAGSYFVTVGGKVSKMNATALTDAERACFEKVYFWGNLGLTDMTAAFKDCINLNYIEGEIPYGDSFAGVTNFDYAFAGCTALTRIPETLFKYSKNATSFVGVFQDCTNITEIPSILFERATSARDLSYTFCGTSITDIPEGLFVNCKEINSLDGTFKDCINLTAIPENLFARCTQVTSFTQTFEGCSALTEIPAGLFDSCDLVMGFNFTFNGCASLQSIPEGLFDVPSSFKTFVGTFMDCTALTEIPVNLFDLHKAGTMFNSAFSGCTSLTGESPYTVVDGQKVHLYERDGSIGGFLEPTGNGCFTGAIGLSDYANMPANWKSE